MTLHDEIGVLQHIVSNTYSLMGYGTASEPRYSGEDIAIKTAFERSPEMNIIFDVGAHEGEYLNLIHPLLPGKEWHCFEPQKAAFEKLQKAAEGLSNVTLNNCAASKENGESSIYTHIVGAANASMAKRDLRYLDVHSCYEEKIKTRNLMSYCTEKNLDHIDFLKIDAEGWEYIIVESVMDFAARGKIKYIQFEYGSANVDTRTFLKDFYLLMRPKFNMYRIHPRGLYLCNDYKEEFECFNLANYLLELRPE